MNAPMYPPQPSQPYPNQQVAQYQQPQQPSYPGQGQQLQQHTQALPTIQGTMDWGHDTAEEDGMTGGISAGYPIVRYKGKIWTIRANGQEKQLMVVLDGAFIPKPTIDVIVLGALDNLSRSYYPGFSDDNAGKRPLCASLDGITHDADAQQPQAPLCAACPRYERRMNNEGKMVRECRDYKRVAVLIHAETAVPYFGQPIWEPAFLRIPPDSLGNYKQFFEHMKQYHWRPYGFVTRIGFAPTPHPKFVFSLGAYQASDPNEWRIPQGPLREYILGLLGDQKVKRILGSDELARKAQRQALAQSGFQVLPAVPPAVPQPAVYLPPSAPSPYQSAPGVTYPPVHKSAPEMAYSPPQPPPAPYQPPVHPTPPVTGPVTIDVTPTVVHAPPSAPPPPPSQQPVIMTAPPPPPPPVAPPPPPPPPPPPQQQAVPLQVQQATAEDVGGGATPDAELEAEIEALLGGKAA